MSDAPINALWPYVLDIPAAMGALLTGGRWFC